MTIPAEVPKLDYPDFQPGPVPEQVKAERDREAKQAAVAQGYNRFAASVAPPKPVVVDTSKFPGGIVPTKLPPKRMQGKVKTTRSMKAAIAETMQSEKPPEKT
jgi:hypothetical protein